ncbi:hypothetical protein C4D60_Mb08t05980 [Musa balbisiana]|uniref:UspA domain-containing protein n=1 Tax=Musa balbisiana TaxID=52838 RepID=A0A4S8K1R7_MUSBA|nr:hypothetical protein C4D60_Mb08t05980 [Musa balbisiana]
MAAEVGKPTMVVGIDDSEHSFYALQWTLRRFFSVADSAFKLVVVHSKPSPASVVGLAGPGAADVLPFVESDLKKIALLVIERAKDLCSAFPVGDIQYELVGGDPRNALCDAVEKHQAEILVVGSHGYGAIKRVVLGSVSDHCAHHAQCTVMIIYAPPKIRARCAGIHLGKRN